MSTPNPAPSGELAPYSELADILTHLPLLAREHRRALRLSLRSAADQAGTSAATLHRLESNVGEVSLSSAIAVLRWMDASYTPVEAPDASR